MCRKGTSKEGRSLNKAGMSEGQDPLLSLGLVMSVGRVLTVPDRVGSAFKRESKYQPP